MKVIFSKSTHQISMLCAFLFFITSPILAQYRFIIDLKIQSTYSFSQFDKGQYVSSSFALRPLFFSPITRYSPWILRYGPYNGGISLRGNITNNIEVEIGWMYWRTMGHKIAITANYLGNNKWSSTHISEDGYIFGEQFPINIYFFSKLQKKIRKFIKIGGLIFSNNAVHHFKIYRQYLYPDSDPGKQVLLEIKTNTYANPYITITLLTGAGIEKIYNEMIFVNLSLIYNQGFLPIYKSEIEYNTPEGILYKNRIFNKANYIGLELNIGINPFYRKQN